MTGQDLYIDGGLLAKGVQIVVTSALQGARLDAVLESRGWDATLRREIRKSPSELVGAFLYWIILLVVFVGLFVAMGHPSAVTLFQYLLGYLTINVMSVVFIMVLSVIFSRVIAGTFQFVGSSVNMPSIRPLSKFIEYVVVIFGLLLSLEQLGIPMAEILKRLDILVGSIALGAAIAFGLGCKDIAGRFLTDLFRQK
jgi:hypothetical protein